MYFACSKSVCALCENTVACIDINGKRTDWFDISQGVKQGDNMSSTLFNMYINELANEINEMNKRLKMGAKYFNLFLYEDDIILILDNEKKL